MGNNGVKVPPPLPLPYTAGWIFLVYFTICINRFLSVSSWSWGFGSGEGGRGGGWLACKEREGSGGWDLGVFGGFWGGGEGEGYEQDIPTLSLSRVSSCR